MARGTTWALRADAARCVGALSGWRQYPPRIRVIEPAWEPDSGDWDGYDSARSPHASPPWREAACGPPAREQPSAPGSLPPGRPTRPRCRTPRTPGWEDRDG